MLFNSYSYEILYEQFHWIYLQGDIKLLPVTVNSRLQYEIEIVHDLSCHPIGDRQLLTEQMIHVSDTVVERRLNIYQLETCITIELTPIPFPHRFHFHPNQPHPALLPFTLPPHPTHNSWEHRTPELRWLSGDKTTDYQSYPIVYWSRAQSQAGWLAQLAERRSFAGELTLFYPRPVADGWPLCG